MIFIRSWQLLTVAVGIIVTCPNVMTFSNFTTADDETSGPTIIPNKNEIILKEGQNFTIYCKWNHPVQIKQQEIGEERTGSFEMVLRDVSSPNDPNVYESALDLYNVDKFTVGYYACFNKTVNETDFLKNIMEEPVNTKNISYIYIYVDETNSLLAPMREVVITRNDTTILVECRPTTPDVNVTLLGQSNKTPEISKYSPKIGFLVKSRKSRKYLCEGHQGKANEMKYMIYKNVVPPTPKIIINSKFFLEGETFSLNCTVLYTTNSAVKLTWNIPRQEPIEESIGIDTNEHNMTGDILYKSITIANATINDAGNYTCTCTNPIDNRVARVVKIYKGNRGYVKLKSALRNLDLIEATQETIRLQFIIDAYPPANFMFLLDGKKLPEDDEKYKITKKYDSVYLNIDPLNIEDTGSYTMVASNEYESDNLTYNIRVKASPVVEFGPEVDKKYLLGSIATLKCEAIGYPLPKIKWVFINETGEENSYEAINSTAESIIRVSSLVKVPVQTSGTVICHARNSEGNDSATRNLLVYEIPGGFGVKNADKAWFPEGQRVRMACYASKYNFLNVRWIRDDNKSRVDIVTLRTSPFSLIATLEIQNISIEDEGNYTCIGEKKDGSSESQTVLFTVAATHPPIITAPEKDIDQEVNPYLPVKLSCQANAVPPPVVTWRRNGEVLHNDSNIDIFVDYLNYTTVNSTIYIKQMIDDYNKYECAAESGGIVKHRSYNLIIKEKSPFKSAIYLSIIGVILLCLVLLIIYLVWKVRKEKQFRKELAAAGLLYFKEGVTRSLNPDLGIDEQAELLPYDERFEYPADKLILGKQLGAGAFGVVYKAEARGIINAEETTPVAVKMVKKTADNMYIKALASELKIMVHLGKHVNIVNLLGACTKNVGKRELIVIVEYCKFGNIHNYMQKHREVFIDQLTDNKEKNLGRENRAFSYSTGSSGMQSDYFGSNHTQETDHTFVNTANTNRSGRKDNTNQHVEFVRVSETGYVQPEWRSNYETDYSFEGRNPRPLTSRDLLAWAFQIARGMEYLANRKVLHGDLAARNILLAEDNIVKICDFGLARSIYKNDEYKKQENSPLPVKWLAIECMTDRIFSTQSDVWSFGIVLWELFSLAKTPYPNVSPTSLVQWLSDGHRLDKPQYADNKLYDVMLRCWQQKPTARPNFSQLQEILGSFLEDNVRNHYVDLNSAYMDLNVKAEGQEDYLAMMCAPDYNNMVTPSPHHYVNEAKSFFPPTPTLQHDDEGYLQMSPTNQSIFSPRAQSAKFDFDARKLNTRASDPNHGSELTPMLTLNNLPARSGSESDYDGNVSPYLNMCPRIEEETDEVFETKQYNFKNTQNNQNSAVTNPTYITFDVDLEKKPQNISNNYINVNGLVK
ncbi:vascular endothelial growth factor receptor 1 isoform X3 [Nymphalis io]|uniref:vascular endothelial growth factor receptor 1 isoform X3 n=1 Tax=Inachis io TaxID=171585 RepID=UPI0021687765|nr:vascular endothelial growth factor receptor 1 isoform X3 [Nymphalis io]